MSIPQTEASATEVSPVRPPWSLLLWCGEHAPEVEEGVRLVDITPASADVDAVVEALSANKLSPADMLTRALFVFDPNPEFRDRVLAAYSALCGFAGRRLDARVGENILPLSRFHDQVAAFPDAGRPSVPIEQAQVGGPGRDDMPALDISEGVSVVTVTVLRWAKRLRFVPPASTEDALAQLVLVAAVRSREGLDRLPMLVTGDEPYELPRNEDGVPGTVGLCLHTVRRAAERLRRSNRGDTRDALAEPREPSARQRRLIEAAAVPLEETLLRLGVRSAVVTVPARGEDPEREEVVYHCPKPQNHTNGDATPSAVIRNNPDGSPGFQCFRCLPSERLDSLRLVMWSMDRTADEASDWLNAR